MFLVVFYDWEIGLVEIWLTESYFEDFAKRRGVLFTAVEAMDVYTNTQLLQQKWPACIQTPPPVVGNKFGLFYVKHNWPNCRLRICFGARTENGIQKIVALTCRTKQELSKGSSNGTQEWYQHMKTDGVDRWDDYRRSLLKCWRIY